MQYRFLRNASIVLALCTAQISFAANIPGVGQVPEIPAFLPMVNAVPATNPMPIDGTWTISSISKTVRIDRGRIYAVDGWLHLFVLKIQPGMVVIQDLKPTAPGAYAGQDLPLMGPLKATMTRDRTMAVEVQGAFGPVRYQLLPLQLDNAAWFDQAMAEAGLVAGVGQPGSQPPGYQPPEYQPPVAESPGYQPLPIPPPPAESSPRSSSSWPTSDQMTRSVRNDSPGPPSLSCGNVGDEACEGDEGRVGAEYTREATWWGCPNENASEGGRKIYFTPHNGGECWACPDGFRRTIKPIHEPNTCNEEGWSRDTATATLHSSAWGCGAHEFRKGSDCYACPNNTEKVSFLGVFNPNETKACGGLPWICNEGEVGPTPNIALQKVGPPIRAFCETGGFDLEDAVRRHMEQDVTLDQALKDAASEFLSAIKDDDDLRDALKDGDINAVLEAIYDMPEFLELRTAAQARSFESFSLGTVADVSLGFGANQELGFAVDWDGTTKVYATTGVSKGISFGADFGLSLGLWKKPASQLSGYAHGLAVSADVGLSVGAAAWFDFYPVSYAGVTFMAGIGVGLELGEYNQVVTSLYEPDTPVAVR